MIETLTCTHGHTWERERKRGIKPTRCPAHKPTVVRETPKATAIPSLPHARSSDAAMDILTGDSFLDHEYRRKLTYVVEQLDDRANIARRDPDDISMLVERQTQLVREHERRWGAR